jgi:tryptophan synthase alpha chain
MSNIKGTFASLDKAREGAFISYVCAGDPDPEFTVEQVLRLSRAGADIIELGLPFSDPLADGPVIQAAMKRALENGSSTIGLISVIKAIRGAGMRKPLIVMTYYNPILQYGIARFCDALTRSGADGILVVDLPPEESQEIDSKAAACGLDMIRLVTPTTSDERMEHILAAASGFVYAVSAAGTTGVRAELPPSAPALIRRAKEKTSLPVALGFGISTPEQVRSALSYGAAGVVEGSALIAMYASLLGDRTRALDAVESHAKSMKQATVRASALQSQTQC